MDDSESLHMPSLEASQEALEEEYGPKKDSVRVPLYSYHFPFIPYALYAPSIPFQFLCFDYVISTQNIVVVAPVQCFFSLISEEPTAPGE